MTKAKSGVLLLLVLVCACGSMEGNEPPGDGGGTGSGTGSGTGTGSNPGGDPFGYRSGTRIKMKVLNTPDGAKVLQGWHDTQRNEECSLRLASDGAISVPAARATSSADSRLMAA